MEKVPPAVDISLHFGVAAGKLRDSLQQFLNIDVIFKEYFNCAYKHTVISGSIICNLTDIYTNLRQVSNGDTMAI